MPYTPLSTANTIQSWRLRINDIDSVKVETPNPTSSGFWNHTGRATISTNLTVSGNVTVSGTANLGRFAQSTTGIILNVDDDLTTRLNCGFWQTSTATTGEGWPETTNGWYHLITSTHDNEANYFSMQLAADFFTQKLWYRSTNNLGTQSWGRVVHTNDTAINQQFNSLGVGTAASGTTGEIRATNNITAYYSDVRLKEVIGKIPDPLKKISQLSGIVYKNNDKAREYGYIDDNEQIGVVAQEVESVLPQIVKPAPFDIGQNKDGSEYSISGEHYKTVQYEKLIPLLIESIKELSKEVEELKSKIR